jgi:hypothetical protein
LVKQIESAKDEFRNSRDEIKNGKSGTDAATAASSHIAKAKKAYANLYYAEHQKRRLTANEAKKKGEIINSQELANLKRLSDINILTVSKLDAIEKDLSALKTCFDLTPEKLANQPFCQLCGYRLGSDDSITDGQIEKITDRIDDLLEEWKSTLINTIDDPLLVSQRDYLNADQKKVIEEFVSKKALPEKVDGFFVEAIKALLSGFEPVTIPADEFIDKLSALGPCDASTFSNKLNQIISAYTKGKDSDKMRIIIKK